MNLSSAGQLAGRLSLGRITVLIFAASSLIYAVSPRGKPESNDLLHGGEIMLVSLNVDRDGSFANPYYWIHTGPTAHTAPAYVLLHAFVANTFGVGLEGSRALWALNIGFLSLQLALLPALAVELGLGIGAGILAAVLALVTQPYRVLPEWEALCTGALLVVLLVATLRRFKTPGESWKFLTLGLLWGVALLTNPECVLLMFLWSCITAIGNSRETRARAWRGVAWVVAGAALVCLPWTIRNYERFHSVFFVRDNFGIELYTSNNPCAQSGAYENLMSGCHWLTHPYGNRAIETEVLEKGEIRFNHEMLRRALSWIRSNPSLFAQLTARRLVCFWFPDLGGLRYSIALGILTILSFAGLAWMFRENRFAAWLISSTLLVFPLIHYVVQFEERYRYPIYWATILPAAYVLIKIFQWRRSTRPDTIGESEREAVSVPG
jgi:hypothetical protein